MKKKILKPMFSLGAALALAISPRLSSAQDDLDDLLKELEGESAEKKAEAPKAEEKAEEPAAEEKAEEPAAEEKAEEPAAEEKAEEPAAEEKAEEPAVEEKAEEPAAEEEAKPVAKTSDDAAAAKKVDEVLSLLDDLEAESKAEAASDGEARPTAEKSEAVAAGQPAAKPAATRRARPDEELLANIAATERNRRDALDKMATKEILDARSCMDDEDYQEAVRHYGLAIRFLNDSPKGRELRKECESGVIQGLFLAAMAEEKIGRHAEARKLMERAFEMGHPKAGEMLAKWKADREEEAFEADTSEVSQVRNEESFKADREAARRHLRRARQYLGLRDLSRALDECEIVLKSSPDNQEATRLRNAIQKKRQVIHEQVREAMRDGMIADVDDAWRPVYAVNATQLDAKASETVKAQAGEDPERTQEQDIEKRMKEMRLPTIEFKPPATIIEAVEFFRTASRDYDRPDIPIEKRGFNFVLRTPVGAIKQAAAGGDEGSDDFSSNESEDSGETANGLPPIPKITASDISFYDALKLVCDSVDYKFIVRGPVVMVMQKDMSTAELLSRKYNVPEAFVERVNTASEEIKEMGGFGSNNRSAKKGGDEESESADRDWKAFFEEMGVKWPEGSSIKHIKALGKLYVRNTRENLAEFEKVLDELGGQPQLIEIETRFVEVSQEDLNSLGFEWILNSDYSLDLTGVGRKVFGLKNLDPYGSASVGTSDGSTTTTYSATPGTSSSTSTSSQSASGASGNPLATDSTTKTDTSSTSSKWTATTTTTAAYSGQRGRSAKINAINGVTDFTETSNMRSSYSNGNRYLSTTGNHISGDGEAYNDQFMRVNAFLGQADLSMILHMLSQRSDTDLLSAPKVVTKSGEQAVIKVVTEYIYPQDYNVQLQSSSSGSSGSSSGSSQSAILAVVEPQNFTMREVGVILDVLPTYSEANGGTIDLELKPSVIDEPTWKNYGMQIPFTGNSSALQSFEGIADIPAKAVEAILALGGTLTSDQITKYQNLVMDASMSAMTSSSGSNNMTWYDAPMEQPFFHVRSIESKVSITPGSTVVMGGLITESRKAMDDKIPFLGDLPFIGRLFRSHAEQTIKRNLLIFVTGRLITPSGREIRMNAESASDAEVKPAPKAE